MHLDQLDRFFELLLYTALAGACIPAGAALARIEHIRPQWLEEEFRHFVTFQDIAPQSRLERHWAPPLGAVLGFALALLADMFLSAF